MNQFSFEYDSIQAKRLVHNFEYDHTTSTEYMFLYGRHFLSDLSEFNPPIFVNKERVEGFLNKTTLHGVPIYRNANTESSTNINMFKINKPTQKSIKIDFLNRLDSISDVEILSKEIIKGIIKNTKAKYSSCNLWLRSGLVTNYSNQMFFKISNKDKTDYFRIVKLQKASPNKTNINQTQIAKHLDDKKNVVIYDNTFLIKNAVDSSFEPVMLKFKNKHRNANRDLDTGSFHYRDIHKASFTNELEINTEIPINILNVYNTRTISMFLSDFWHLNYINSISLKMKYINNTILLNSSSAVRTDFKLNSFKEKVFLYNKSTSKHVYVDMLNYRLENRNVSNTKKFANVQGLILDGKDIVYNNSPTNINKYTQSLKHLFINSFVSKDRSYFGSSKNSYNLSKGQKRMFETNKDIFIYGDKKNLKNDLNSFYSGDMFIDLDSDSFVIKDDGYHLMSNDIKEIHNVNYTSFVNRKNGRTSFVIMDFDDFIRKEMIDINTIERISDNNYSNTILTIVPTLNDRRRFSIFDYNVILSKVRKESWYEEIESLTKKMQSSYYTENFNIWSFKDSHKAFLEYNSVMLKKKSYNAILESNKDFINSLPKDAFIDDIKAIIKNKKQTRHNKDVSIDSILNKDTVLQKQFWWYKVAASTVLNSEAKFVTNNDADNGANKTSYLHLYDSVFANKSSKELYFKNSDRWLRYEAFNIGYDNKSIGLDIETCSLYNIFKYENDLFVDTVKKDISNIKGKNFENTFLNKSNKSFYVNETSESFLEKLQKEMSQGDKSIIFFDKTSVKASAIANEISIMKDTIRKLDIPNPKIFNWAWVYEYEDPIKPNEKFYGIDELLLPEKDIDYDEFVDMIFDKTRMKPRNPIKIVDDTTFIAKYPVKHPIPNYEDVGIEYVNVPSKLMKDIFLVFYQTWYNNVFKFGNMAMIDSINLMMEYMHSHIVLNYSGGECFKEALRVFRLIRWFAETSVMHNAQYIISYEYEDLKSNLQTGVCQVNNKMKNMSVNKEMAAIVTDPESYGISDSYVTFYINNKQDTNISFSISLWGGIAEVYLNNELISVISKNKPLASYEIPFTGKQNSITIKRPVEKSIGFCYIGNVIVKNEKFKELSVKYDPDFKMGNLPLNDVVQKMILLANMYENEEEMLRQFQEGNLAISALYEHLKNYWELHHQDKIKGKRLTIKEV